MSQQLLVLAAGLSDRHQPLAETAMFVSPKRKYESPRENKIVVCNTSVCWGVYRKLVWKEGAQIWVSLQLCLMRDMSCPSETVLCLIGRPLVLCQTMRVWICAMCTPACMMQVVEQRNLEFAVSYIFMLVTRKFTRIWSTNFRHTQRSTDLYVRSNVSWCGEPYISVTCSNRSLNEVA